MFVGGGTELFDIVLTMHGMGPFAEEAARSVIVSVGAFEVRVLPLDRILASKTNYSANLERLRRIKAQWEADNLLDLNQNMLFQSAAPRDAF
jgi:hypothetical protein